MKYVEEYRGIQIFHKNGVYICPDFMMASSSLYAVKRGIKRCLTGKWYPGMTEKC